MILNDKIYLLRKALKLNQKTFGKPLELSQVEVSRLEKTRVNIPAEIVQKIKEVYSIDIHKLNKYTDFDSIQVGDDGKIEFILNEDGVTYSNLFPVTINNIEGFGEFLDDHYEELCQDRFIRLFLRDKFHQAIKHHDKTGKLPDEVSN